MKKIILASVLCMIPFFCFASEASFNGDDGLKAPVSVNRFVDNWFIGGGAGVNTILDNGFLGKTGLGVDLYAGKWVIPACAFRVGWHGLNNQAIDTSNGWFAGEDQFSYNFAHVDWVWDILNTFRYSPKRVVNPQLNIQAGCIFTSHDGVRNQEFGLGGGAAVAFRISKRVAATVEASAILAREEAYRTAGKLVCFPSVTAGVAVNIGKVGFDRREKVIVKTVEVVKDCGHDSQILSLLKQIDSLKAIKPEMKIKTVTRPAIIYFDLDKSDLSRREKAHLEFLVEHLPEGARLIITGHADKETGNPRYNLRLSERRAKTVARELEKLGVAPECISSDWAGDTRNDFSTKILGTTTNRCCYIQVAL